MANGNDLFDDEPGKPEKPAKPASSQGQRSGAGGGPLGGPLTRRKFLAGAGAAAAAGAAVGTGATLGIGALGGDDETPAADAASEVDGVTLGVPAGRSVSQAVVKLNVNGRDHWLTVTPNQSLAEVLRIQLGMTGTKIGCDRSECSACTVIIDDVPHNSCSLLAIREGDKKIVTIEGLEQGTELSPVQQAFLDNMGLQCGFCTPGQIMQATALLKQNPNPDEATIRRALSGNLCKCAAYPNILASVKAAAESAAG